MFQYAIARSLADITGDDFSLDISGFATYKVHRYALGDLSITENIASVPAPPWYQQLLRRNPVIWKQSTQRVVREDGLGFNQAVLATKGDAYLDGYWQSEKYFLNIAGLLRKEFIPKSVSEAVQQQKKTIESDTGAVSLHIRRGDYVTNPKVREVLSPCPLSYYSAAINYIRSRVGGTHFFVFSDDIAWVKQADLGISGHATYIEGNMNFEDMYLMSSCRHNIIANSTFGWWGAWLNRHVGKIVIAPKRWFNTQDMVTDDLIPESWVKV